VGPEVSVAAAAVETKARIALVGDLGALREAARGRGIPPDRLSPVAELSEAWALRDRRIGVWQTGPALAERDRRPGHPTRASGAAQLAWIDEACDAVARGDADAMVTGPVSKEAIVRSGAPGAKDFLGHTEHLQRRLRSREVVMAFWSPALVTALATTHVPLARVPREVTGPAVARAAYWLVWLLRGLGTTKPRVAVASLNPHAGEGGLLGAEERTRIVPGIASARRRATRAGLPGLIEGPIPAETAFRLAGGRRWDGVVAMYHDQATIPMKLAEFGEAVNVSLGLPIVRTSVDHGTAYDRAGTFTADPQGMRSALALARRLAARS
jgi:4-hydroxythreonine-4-phosphate dehydrogenase